jgi:hypothetical protein
MDDQFVEIAGYPGYRINRDGEVQSRWSRGGRRKLTETWLPLKPVPCRQYLTVNLSDGVKKRRRYIHRLVLETFVGPCPEGMICCHNDGNPENNCLANLRWDTYLANEHDKHRHGTWLVGEQINAKLTGGEVVEIRRLRGEGMTFSEIAVTYGVTRQNVEKIVSRQSWRHLP